MRIPGLSLLLLACISACTGGDDNSRPADNAAEEPCRTVQEPVELPAEIRESSGIAGSRRHAGLLWTHNDSGNDPDLFAIDSAGQLLARMRVTGARNQDWEDIALGPCPTGDCLYIGDIGDGRGKDEPMAIYRLPEPDPGSSQTAGAERFRVRFPDGSRDAEALFVLPSGELYIITKEKNAALFRYPLPLRTDETVTLAHVADLSIEGEERVTGADATPDGSWIAVRTGSTLLLYRTEELTGGSSTSSPIRMDLTPLGGVQGEAVAISNQGTVVLTSEGGTRRSPASISRLVCTLP